MSETMGCSIPPEVIAETNRRLRLFAAWEKVGPRAREALCVLAERMVVGAERYGADFTEPKNWRREAHEEALDGAIYLAVETLPEPSE